MKHFRHYTIRLSIVAFLLLGNYVSKAQFVTVPDATFVTWLNTHGYAGCLSGTQLDTTCSAVLNATTMGCYGVPIHDLTGIQYFKNLINLDCSNDSIRTIPALPPALVYFNCNSNRIINLPGLPASLQSLHCDLNVDGYFQLSVLPPLPNGLDTLSCEYFIGSSLPTLPDSLKYLDCRYSDGYTLGLTSLPALPAGLTYLDCWNDFHITNLPALPNGLKKIMCGAIFGLHSLPALPDSLIYLNCYDDSLNALPPLPPLLSDLECQNNQISIMPPLPDALQTFYCGQNLLDSLPALPAGLWFLDCSYNHITSLPVLPSMLFSLGCDYNQLTGIPALPPYMNSFTCSYNQITSLPSLPTTSSTINPFYIFDCSHNLLTSIPALPAVLHYCLCNNNPYLTCMPQLTTITTLRFDSTAVVCLPNYGTVTSSTPALNTVQLCGNTNPYGCPLAWNISGTDYYDANINCQLDGSDVGQSYIKMLLYDGGGVLQQQVYSSNAGEYSMQAPFGDYTIQPDTADLPFVPSCSGQGYLNTSISAQTPLSYSNDFSFACRSGFDVGVQSIINDNVVPRPAATFTLLTTAGDISELYGAHCAAGVSGQVTLFFSGPVTFAGMAPGGLTPDSVTGNTLLWIIPDYGTVNDSTAFNAKFLIDANATAGSSVCFDVVATPISGDYNISNNRGDYCFNVVDALDPNEKEVFPETVDSAGQWLTYTVRFQNTGNAPALHVLITDTLDSHLDPATFQLLAFSAKTTVQINGRAVTFNFTDINLPDSATDKLGSKGYVQYRVKTNSLPAPANAISNTAYIYFDLNPAVVTNTVANYITGIRKIEANALFNIYPNPASNKLFIRTENLQAQSITIYDTEGRLINTMSFKNEIDINQLSAGVYFVEVKSNEGVTRKRFVKM